MLERARWLRRSLRIYVLCPTAAVWPWKKTGSQKDNATKVLVHLRLTDVPLFSQYISYHRHHGTCGSIPLSEEYHSFHLISDEDCPISGLRTLLCFRIDCKLVIGTLPTHEAKRGEPSRKLQNAARENEHGSRTIRAVWTLRNDNYSLARIYLRRVHRIAESRETKTEQLIVNDNFDLTRIKESK